MTRIVKSIKGLFEDKQEAQRQKKVDEYGQSNEFLETIRHQQATNESLEGLNDTLGTLIEQLKKTNVSK